MLEDPQGLPASPSLLSFEIPGVDLLSWLELQHDSSRFYWKGRDGALEIAGAGEALVVSSHDPHRLESSLTFLDFILSAHPQREEMIFFAAMKFNAFERNDAVWSDLPPFSFVLPRVFLTRRGQTWKATLVRAAGPDAVRNGDRDISARKSMLMAQIRRLTVSPPPHGPELPAIRARRDHPEPPGWREMIATAHRSFQEQLLGKVVLARRTEVTCDDTINPISLLRSLQHVKQECFSFLATLPSGAHFVGASPERLVRIEHGKISSDALGGTTGRGAEGVDDERLGEELLCDRKSLDEHLFVADDLRAKFRSLATNVVSPPSPQRVVLADVQHLLTPIQGTLKPALTLHRIISTLHPTPAVCGTPCEEAHRFIGLHEPFARGWYAGPIGVVGHEFVDLAVAIRSLVLQGATASLFAGAGIVAASDPELELQEIENKIITALKLFSTQCLKDPSE